MLFDRERANADRRMETMLRIALPLALTAAGVWAAWRFNQSRTADASVDWRNPYGGRQGLPDHMPHTKADEDVVEAAAEDSFPASDPPAYTAGDRMGPPPRH